MILIIMTYICQFILFILELGILFLLAIGIIIKFKIFKINLMIVIAKIKFNSIIDIVKITEIMLVTTNFIQSIF